MSLHNQPTIDLLASNGGQRSRGDSKASFRSASHFPIFCLLRSVLSQSIRHPLSLFFNVQILDGVGWSESEYCSSSLYGL